jgi:hypothetical protein
MNALPVGINLTRRSLNRNNVGHKAANDEENG